MTHPGICPRREGQKAEPQGWGHVAKHPLKLKRKCVFWEGIRESLKSWSASEGLQSF